MSHKRLEEQLTPLKTGNAPARSVVTTALGSGNRDHLGITRAPSPAAHAAAESQSAFDSASGHTLTPMGAGLGAPSANAPVQAKKAKPEDSVRFSAGGESPTVADIGTFFRGGNTSNAKAGHDAPERAGLYGYLSGRLGDQSKYGNGLTSVFGNASGSVFVKGFSASRTSASLQGTLGEGMDKEQIGDMYEDLLSGGRYRQLREIDELGNLDEAGKAELAKYTPEQVAGLDERFDRGMMQMKAVQLAQLRRLKDKYGVYGSQMHPEDFITRVGPEFFSDIASLQDTEQMMRGAGKYFDYENNAEDREFRTLSDYYNDVYGVMQNYASTDSDVNIGNGSGDFDPVEFKLEFFRSMGEITRAQQSEGALRALGAAGFSDKEQSGYEGRVRKRFGSKKNRGRLFGRFSK